MPVIWVLGLLGVYALYTKNKAVGVKVPGSNPSNYQPSQPSQLYPWGAIVPPRTDNASQPWYNGSQKFNPPTTTPQDVAIYAGVGQSVIHSLSDVWGMLSPASDSNQSLSLASVDDMGTFNDGAPVNYDNSTSIVSDEMGMNSAGSEYV